MISRRHRVQEKKLTRKGVFLLLFSVVLLVFLLIFGIPILAQFAAFVNEIKGSSAPIVQEDKTPPAPPSFNPPLPEYTQSEKITVTGRVEAGSTLKVYKNDVKIKEILIDDSSKFSLEIPIDKGENAIWATATDSAGNESGLSSPFRVIYDKEPPKLNIAKPSDNEDFYGQDKTITIEGETEPDAGVMINNRLAIVDSEGKFSQKIALSEGENKLTIVATDQAENKTEQTIAVTYTP